MSVQDKKKLYIAIERQNVFVHSLENSILYAVSKRANFGKVKN